MWKIDKAGHPIVQGVSQEKAFLHSVTLKTLFSATYTDLLICVLTPSSGCVLRHFRPTFYVVCCQTVMALIKGSKDATGRDIRPKTWYSTKAPTKSDVKTQVRGNVAYHRVQWSTTLQQLTTIVLLLYLYIYQCGHINSPAWCYGFVISPFSG